MNPRPLWFSELSNVNFNVAWKFGTENKVYCDSYQEKRNELSFDAALHLPPFRLPFTP